MPVSATEWIASASSDAEPVNANPTNLAAAIGEVREERGEHAPGGDHRRGRRGGAARIVAGRRLRLRVGHRSSAAYDRSDDERGEPHESRSPDSVRGATRHRGRDARRRSARVACASTIEASGVCHSDLSAATGAVPMGVPMILGHEGAGTVLAVGPEVHAREAGRPGHRVVRARVRRLLVLPPRPVAALRGHGRGVVRGQGHAARRHARACDDRARHVRRGDARRRVGGRARARPTSRPTSSRSSAAGSPPASAPR